MMKRRIQVFVGSEASAALDELMEIGKESQTKAIEMALVERQTRLPHHAVEEMPGAHGVWRESQPIQTAAREVLDATSGSNYRTRTGWQPHTTRVGFEGPTEDNPTRGVSEPDLEVEEQVKEDRKQLPPDPEYKRRVKAGEGLPDRLATASEIDAVVAACPHPAKNRVGRKCSACNGRWK